MCFAEFFILKIKLKIFFFNFILLLINAHNLNMINKYLWEKRNSYYVVLFEKENLKNIIFLLSFRLK